MSERGELAYSAAEGALFTCGMVLSVGTEKTVRVTGIRFDRGLYIVEYRELRWYERAWLWLKERWRR